MSLLLSDPLQPLVTLRSDEIRMYENIINKLRTRLMVAVSIIIASFGLMCRTYYTNT